jgi:hypothetical protein
MKDKSLSVNLSSFISHPSSFVFTDIFPLQQRCLTDFIRNSKYCCFYPQIALIHADFLLKIPNL